MSRIVKTLLTAFLLICVIVFIVFAFQLLLLNREDGEAGNAGQGISGSSPPAATGSTPPPTGPGSAGQGSAGPGSAGSSPLGSSPTASGKQTQSPPASVKPTPIGSRFELPMPDNSKLVLYADEELFDHEMMDLGDMFVYKASAGASLEIHIDYIGQGADKAAEIILNNHLDGDDASEATIEGMLPVGKSSLSGVYVHGERDGTTYAAWICDISAAGGTKNVGALGLGLTIIYKDDRQKAAIYEILDSMEIVYSASA